MEKGEAFGIMMLSGQEDIPGRQGEVKRAKSSFAVT